VRLPARPDGDTRAGRTRRDLDRLARSPIEKAEPRSLDELDANGPPLSTGEFAQMIGMSSTFVRSEIRSGHLRAAAVGRGRKPVFRIPVREALRYAKELGLV
jgi:hypothetical protein